MIPRELIDQIKLYETVFRNPNRPKFVISQKYDLYPLSQGLENSWPHSYPFAERAGVYVILDEDNNILYIGKSSKYIRGRLSSYFKYGEHEECQLKHDGWTTPPKYVITIPMEADSSFECASLEEFLIFTISPSDNYNLKRK